MAPGSDDDAIRECRSVPGAGIPDSHTNGHVLAPPEPVAMAVKIPPYVAIVWSRDIRLDFHFDLEPRALVIISS